MRRNAGPLRLLRAKGKLGGKKVKKYSIIYADPPWPSEKGWFNNKAWKSVKFENHYPTMDVEDICALNVKDIADKNAHHTSALLQHLLD